MNIPVYLFTGFLEAGKTKFISETLADERFNAGERTLVLLCEEGMEEYDAEKFAAPNVYIETIENETDITGKLLHNLQKKHKAERVIVEFNGMWMIDSLYNNCPRDWTIAQEMVFFDATTFDNYNANMRSLVVDKLKSAEVVIFNRTTEKTDKEQFHKIIRATSRRANIAFEYTDGHVEYDEIEDPLPFDITADPIVIRDTDFAFWYRDASESPEKYQGKNIMFKGIVAKNKSMPKDICVIGRHIMTCCADDISYAGMILKIPDGCFVQNRDWIMATVRFQFEFHKLYEEKGPVLYATSLVHTTEPTDPVVSFY